MRSSGVFATEDDMKGKIFDIQRLSVHDGPGIRTTVFMKGCPLRCAWCHNPESQSLLPSLAYNAEKCIGCGRCATACRRHSFDGGVHRIDRDGCDGQGACASVCPTGALELYGRDAELEEIMGVLLRDRAFYKSSGGGLTVSGGEPLCQPDFLCALLERARAEGIHTCIETCGYASEAVIRRVLPLVDIFLYDFKESDDALHRKYTGVSSVKIIENLRLVDSLGGKTVLRCPIIPGINDRESHLDAIAELAANLSNVLEVNVMAYHLLGTAKYGELGMEDKMVGVPAMTAERKAACIEHIKKRILLTYGRQIEVK